MSISIFLKVILSNTKHKCIEHLEKSFKQKKQKTDLFKSNWRFQLNKDARTANKTIIALEKISHFRMEAISTIIPIRIGSEK